MLSFIVKVLALMFFSLISGFTLALGTHESNIKKYYFFTALSLVGVMLLV